MGVKKEIRFSIDAATEDNRQLIGKLSNFRPHERNRIILDVLVAYFVKGNVGRTHAACITSDDKEMLEYELDKLKSRMEKVESILFNRPEQANKNKEHGISDPGTLQNEYTQQEFITRHSRQEQQANTLDIREEHAEDRADFDIPEEVMAMITSLQDSQ